FFSSRRRHTRFSRDWSSDVCSSDLKQLYGYRLDKMWDEKDFNDPALSELINYAMWSSEPVPFDPMEKTLHKIYEQTHADDQRKRSEERRVGKEVRNRWETDERIKKK